MDEKTQTKWSLVLAFAAALTAVITSGISAYQTYLLRIARDDAFASNLQMARIDACSGALGYLASSLSGQGLGVFLLRERPVSEDYEQVWHEHKLMLAKAYKEKVGYEHEIELRNHLNKLHMLFPRDKVLMDFLQKLGVFEFSYKYHLFLIEIGFDHEKSSEAGIEVDYELLVDAFVEDGTILSFEQMEEALISLKQGTNQIFEMCSANSTSPGLDLE